MLEAADDGWWMGRKVVVVMWFLPERWKWWLYFEESVILALEIRQGQATT